MKKNVLVSLILTAAMTASLTACSSPESGEAAGETGASGQTEAAEHSASGTGSQDASESGNEENAETDGEAADGEYVVGIGQFAVHGSLDHCREGFIQGLAEEGIEEGKNLTILYENANSDGATSSQIVSNFLAQDVDLICAIATPIAQSAYSAARKEELPVVYTAVTDPVAAELANADGTPVGEITGTSDKLPVKEQLAMIREVLPDAKTIGIMYSTSEVNSLSTLEEYKAAAPEYGFEIVESGVSTTSDVPLAADQLAGKVDCINNLTDNTVVSALQVVLDAANKAGIPVFGSEIEQVKAGCLASVGLDYIELGKQTGRMAAAILKGEEKAGEMNFEVIEGGSFYGNSAVAANLGITLPEDLVANAAQMFGEISQ